MPASTLTFDHFEVKTDELGAPIRLGPGGMGTTYRAFDTRLRKNVALKIIHEQLLQDPTSRLRFFNEARAAALVDHPNVARVLYLCPEDATQYFFAMELVDGESLASRVARHGPLAPREALQLLRPVADALSALGEHHLVHRDIKPENIMLARTGTQTARVKLIDFGLAKSLAKPEGRFADAETGERFVGSVYFASPEQIRSREQLDARSDFYSLGATLWHVLTGFPPFTGTVFEVQEAHVYREPYWEKIAEAPPPIRVLLRRLLAKARADRPADAHALLTAWDEAISGLETDAAADSPLTDAVPASAELPPTRTGEEAPEPMRLAPTPVDEKQTVAVPRDLEPVRAALEKKVSAALAQAPLGTRREKSRRTPSPNFIRPFILVVCAVGVLVAAFIFVQSMLAPLNETTPPLATATPMPVATPIPIATPIPMAETPPPAAPTPAPRLSVPPPVEPPAPDNPVLREKIVQFLHDYTDLSQDPASIPAFFAPSVDYYKEGLVDRAHIRRDSEDYLQRWPQQTQTLEGAPKIDFAPDASTAEVTYVIRFDVRNGPASVRGRTEEHISLDLRSGAPLITSIKSNVLEREAVGSIPPKATPVKGKPKR